MNGGDYSDCVAIGPEAEGAHASNNGQGFERGSLLGLTTEDLHSVSEPPTDNHSFGPHGSPDHTLVYNAVYQSRLNFTAWGSRDEICSSTPNRKSKPMHGMHLKKLSVTSINPSITEYAPSCFSLKVAEPSPPNRGTGLCIGTSPPAIPTFPTIKNTSEIYPPDALLAIPDQYVLTGLSSAYIPLAALGRGVHGKVFAARLKNNPDDSIYALKTIPKASLEQCGVTGVTKELWILRSITDASLSNKHFPFLQKLKEIFQDEKNLFIVLEYFPTTLAQTEMATPFRLSQKTTPPGLLLSPLKAYQSEKEAIQALRFLAAELTLGLLFLHRHGVVHQDIKPANVMISKKGHAVIGGFGAASALPAPCQPNGNPLERPCPPSCVDKDGATYGSIVLQPGNTVTFTPLYAAPELLERKENGLLIYDERADWWSLGVLLYEMTTGGIPFHTSSDAVSIGKGRRSDDENGLFFDLLEGLDLAGSTAHGCDAHLDGYLRSLLVRDPCHRLSGERAKLPPFLEPLQNIWAEVEDLRHPPCPKPSTRVLCAGDIVDPPFDLQEDLSKFEAQCTQISYSRHVLETPQSPLDEEFYTPREEFSSPEQNSLESPPFLTRRMEALAVKRPGGQALWNDSNAVDSNRLHGGGSSLILQQEAFMSYYIESSFQTNRSLSVGKPLPSTAPIRPFSLGEHSYGICSMPRRGIEESFDEDIVRAETSFADSGLDFPLGSSPESWGHRKSDSFRKPLALRPIYDQGIQEPAKDRGGRIHNENMAETKTADFPKSEWTFDEKITISLLQAGLRKRETSEHMVRPLSKPQSVATVSERIIKAARRRVADTLRRR